MNNFSSLISFKSPEIKQLIAWKQGDEEDNWSRKAKEALAKKQKDEKAAALAKTKADPSQPKQWTLKVGRHLVS